MTLQQVARLIPAEFRDQILEANAIYKAIAVPGDPHMFILFTVWTTFVNPHGGLDLSCTRCLSDILKNFKALQEIMIEQRANDQLIDL